MGSPDNKNQKKALQLLLDQYEKSKTYAGDNRKRQTFSIAPEKIFPKYSDSFADIGEIEDFERDMQELSAKGLVRLTLQQGEIRRIVAVEEKLPEYYRLLGREEKRELLARERQLYESYKGKHPTLDKFCRQQLARLERGNKAEYPLGRAEGLLKAAAEILENREELLERELSISLFGDSKAFERSYRAAVCRILERNGDYSGKLYGVMNEREKELIILGEHNVHANPSYVYLRGYGEFVSGNGNLLQLTPDCPIALSARAIEGMKEFRIKCKSAMTVENLTTFHRMQSEEVFYIYLSGYHNTLKQYTIRRLAAENPMLRWYHFGDLDPDGFFILEHLKRGTGISFEAFHMGVEDLEKYREFGKCLEENDRKKAETLMSRGLYREELSYMLRENRKLEQEIISWKQGKDTL
ncbi:MAG: DUF2220 domain-containing protein [Firmicutes bacterium]|nr:DUF2220 domain-containing protein [Bacillota bacterium]